jgi:hypothetical protein
MVAVVRQRLLLIMVVGGEDAVACSCRAPEAALLVMVVKMLLSRSGGARERGFFVAFPAKLSTPLPAPPPHFFTLDPPNATRLCCHDRDLHVTLHLVISHGTHL